MKYRNVTLLSMMILKAKSILKLTPIRQDFVEPLKLLLIKIAQKIFMYLFVLDNELICKIFFIAMKRERLT